MVIFNTVQEVQDTIGKLKASGKTVGFVPTMGALHNGHLSLICKAKATCDIVVSSIFVNPTQFNNSSDLDKYPRMPEKDIELLKAEGCDFVFLPTEKVIYPESYEHLKMDLSPLDEVMEGKYRPGHFAGVVDVVARLFDIVTPSHGFFGRKDFQQVAIIRYMTKKLGLDIEIVTCDTIREKSGLAMSSRNLRLSEREKEEAVVIFDTLNLAKELALFMLPEKLVIDLIANIETSNLELEYLEIVDPDTLLPLTDTWVVGATVCIVAYCGDVRLIDNMDVYPAEV